LKKKESEILLLKYSQQQKWSIDHEEGARLLNSGDPKLAVIPTDLSRI
jgi:hypothetical protein